MKQETKSAIKLINLLDKSEISDSVAEFSEDAFEKQVTGIGDIVYVEKLTTQEIAKIQRNLDKIWSLEETKRSIESALSDTRAAMEEEVSRAQESEKDAVANKYGEDIASLEFELDNLNKELEQLRGEKTTRRVIKTWDDPTPEEMTTLKRYERSDIDKFEYADYRY